MSRAATYAWLSRYRIAPDVRVVAQQRLAQAWHSGRTVEQMADCVGVTPGAIRERLVSAAVLTPLRHYFIVGSPADPLPLDLLRQWYVLHGFSPTQIAEMTGTTARQVRYRLGRYRLSRAGAGPSTRLKRLLPATVLRRLYEVKRLSCPQIAARFGISSESVRRLLRHYGIARRPSGRRGTDGRPPLDADRLRALYVEQGKTLQQIALELGYLTPAGNPAVLQVRSALDRAGLTTRRGPNWTTRQRTKPDTDVRTLHHLYVDQALSIANVARRLGWLTPAGEPAATYTRARLIAAGIQLRKPGPARGRKT